MPDGKRPRLKIVVSHPIQYHAPLFRRLATSTEIELEVLFLSRHGLSPSYDEGFGQRVEFDTDLVSGFKHTFLRGITKRSNPASPVRMIHPSLMLNALAESDVVLLHGWASPSMWLAAINSRMRSIPYMIRGEARLKGLERLDAHTGFRRALVRNLVTRAALCLPIGSDNSAFYQAYGVPSNRLVSAPYSIDTQAFSAYRTQRIQAQHTLRVRHAIQPDKRIVLFAGKLVDWKRPKDFLSAVTRLDANVHAIVVGSGPLEDELVGEFGDNRNITFVGFINQSEMPIYYSAAEVFVLPSSFEPWGLAVNEAMAAGCLPVVSDACGCANDLVEPTTGAVFPVGNVDAMAQQIRRLLEAATSNRFQSLVCEKIEEYSIQATARGIERASKVATAR